MSPPQARVGPATRIVARAAPRRAVASRRRIAFLREDGRSGRTAGPYRPRDDIRGGMVPSPGRRRLPRAPRGGPGAGAAYHAADGPPPHRPAAIHAVGMAARAR